MRFSLFSWRSQAKISPRSSICKGGGRRTCLPARRTRPAPASPAPTPATWDTSRAAGSWTRNFPSGKAASAVQVPGAGRAPGSRTPRDAAGQSRRHASSSAVSSSAVALQGIDLNRQRRRSVVGRKAGLRLLRPQNGLAAASPATWDGCTGWRDAVPCILVRDRRAACSLFRGELAAAPRSPGPAALARPLSLAMLHRLIDSGAVRHFVQKQDLIGPNPQNIQQRRLQVVHLLGAVGCPGRSPAAAGSAARRRRCRLHSAASRPVRPSSAELGLQGARPPRPRPCGSAIRTCRAVSRASGALIRCLPDRGRRRPRKISTYRSSCSRRHQQRRHIGQRRGPQHLFGAGAAHPRPAGPARRWSPMARAEALNSTGSVTS